MDLNTIKVGIFGLGHIGVPTAAILANNHINVIGIDVNPKVVDMINNEASVHFKEPYLDELLKKAIQSNYLHATTDIMKASQECNIFIVIVPTPTYDDKTADLSYVISACESIKNGLKKDDLVIIESTVPPQTGIDVIKPILEESGLKCGEDFMLAYSPERALPNNTIYEMTHNVRIIGGYNTKSADMAEKLYKNITQGEIIKVKNITSAEMIKLMENTYRDVNIALANEFALICENINVDVNEVITAANYHPRVNIHTPGPGVGGHCIPVDPYFLVELANAYDTDAKLISEARRINNSMPQHVIDILLDNILDKRSDYTVSVLGIAYKGNVDDIRESPSIKLIELLKQLELNVSVNDPYVSCDVIKSFDVECVSLDEALKSDCVILMTDHHEYINITPDMLENKFIIATRPILDADEFRKAGINYQAIGNLDEF
ncbi:nucleotide sugar dehydrogenase [Methanosphaera cuniculi]|uniref:nucleotide sugar dehydrogenase n=1 Tax=Methanosphaera cuniculi TaxID=1077256 RepID=UPI0026EF2B23|nr:nucleotide sugar dehydrogenase [Methanosphaera cuniculi]